MVAFRMLCHLLTYALAVPAWANLATLSASGGLTVDVGAGGNYSIVVDGQRWLESAVVSFRSNTVLYTAGGSVGNNLKLISSTTDNGTDSTFGSYRSISLTWAPAKSHDSTRFVTTFKALLEHSAIIFEQFFPDGVDFAASPKGDGKSDISAGFPTFRMERAAGGPLLHAFAGASQNTASGNWSAGAKLGGRGVHGGTPLALYTHSEESGMRTVVMSPLTNHMAAGTSAPDPALSVSGSAKVCAMGLLASVTQYPKGFEHQSIILAGGRVTDTMMAWGDALLMKGGKKRTTMQHPTDRSLTDLGYWTDNGAWYHYLCSECCGGGGAQNPCPCPAECKGNNTMQDVMLSVKADWHTKGIPANYFMFDSWWYRKDGDPDPTNATHPWPVRTSGGVIEWVPEPNVFPSGLQGDFIGEPTFLHNRCFSPNNVYLALPQFQNSFVCEKELCLPTDEALFGHIMDVVKPWRPFVYEQDWISKVIEQSQSATNSTSIGRMWLDSMNAAALKRNITIQFSMSKTPAILHSTTMQAVSQIRASGDYVAGGSQWKIGEVSLYYWALGVVPSKDTFWTTKHQPGCPKAGTHNCTEMNLEVQMLMAVLSGGPVGPGDRLGATDAAMAMRSCHAGGKILRPDRPLAPLDLVFERAAMGLGMDIVWTTYTDRRAELEQPSAVWHYIFGAELEAGGIEIHPGQLLLPAPRNATFVAVPIISTDASWPVARIAMTLQTVDFNAPFQLTTGPTSPFSCGGPAFCEHDGRYCDGTNRALMHEGGEDAAGCKKICDAKPACNCFSHALKPAKTGANCRTYSKASKLTQSKGGYDAFVKPSSMSGIDATGSDGVTPFTYWVLAPQLMSGFTVVGELAKAVPASRQRICKISEPTGARVSIRLCGVPGELVKVSYVAPRSVSLSEVHCTLGDQGRAEVSCAGVACACVDGVSWL